MGETLTFANEQGAYPLTDKGTFLAFQADLDIVPPVTEGDTLLNRYSAIAAHIDRLPLEPELEPAREEYLQGVREIRDAGSFLWRGAATLRAGDFRSAETAFMSGEEHINAAYRMHDMGGTGPDDRTLPPPDPTRRPSPSGSATPAGTRAAPTTSRSSSTARNTPISPPNATSGKSASPTDRPPSREKRCMKDS